MKLLVVEDNKELSDAVAEGLRIDGYYVDVVSSGESAVEKIEEEEYDLVILDLNLPDMSGFDVLREVSSNVENLKVLILTANSDIDSKVQGFDLGASDYLTKPFHFKELEIRVGSLLRRKFSLEKTVLSCGDLEFDMRSRTLFAEKTEVPLTKKEKSIIEYMLINQDKIVSSEDLIAHAWDSEVDYFSNSIRVHLTSLRKKIKNVLGYNPIINKIGEGYFLKR